MRAEQAQPPRIVDEFCGMDGSPGRSEGDRPTESHLVYSSRTDILKSFGDPIQLVRCEVRSGHEYQPLTQLLLDQFHLIFGNSDSDGTDEHCSVYGAFRSLATFSSDGFVPGETLNSITGTRSLRFRRTGLLQASVFAFEE